jgi:hypothetical protein
MLAGYPLLAYLSGLFEYPQGLFIVLIALFFLYFYRFRDSGKLLPLFWAGVWLGLGILTVPTALLFAAALYLLVLTRDWAESLQRIAVLTLALVLTVGAWTARNYMAYDRFILVNKAGGYNFWSSNNETYYKYGKPGIVPPCAPGYENTEFCQDWLALGKETRSKGYGVPDKTTERVEEEERIAWSHVRKFLENNPALFAQLTAQRFVRFWSPIPDAVLEGESRGGVWRDVVATISYAPVLLLAIIGLVISARDWRKLLPVYLFAITFIAPYSVFLPVMRYRLPIDFIFIIFASLTWVRLWDFLRKHTSHPEGVFVMGDKLS